MKNPQLRSTTDALLLEQHINIIRNYGNLYQSRGSGWTRQQLWIQQISHFSHAQHICENSDSCFCFSNSRPAWGPRCCPCYITPLLAVYFIKLSLMVVTDLQPAGFAALLWTAVQELTEGRSQPTACLPTASDNDLSGTKPADQAISLNLRISVRSWPVCYPCWQLSRLDLALRCCGKWINYL